MKNLNGLSVIVKECPYCGNVDSVEYWAHSEDTDIKRYQCGHCAKQTADFRRMDISAEEYVSKMARITDLTRDEYVFRFGMSWVKTESGDFTRLFRLLE